MLFFLGFKKEKTLNFRFCFCSMKFRDVIADASGVSGCILVQAVLRDVAVARSWRANENTNQWFEYCVLRRSSIFCANENTRLQPLMSLLCLLLFIKLAFVENRASSSRVGQKAPIEASFGRCVSCDQTPASKCAFVLRALLRERRIMGQVPLAVGRRGATFAIVAVSSQFVVKCASADFGWFEGYPMAAII